MYYFKFHDDWGTWRVSSDGAQALLKVSKRTIQNYQNPDKRDAGRWDYLTAHTTGRIIPADWDLRIRGEHIHSGTGYKFSRWDLEQIAHAHSIKDNTIAGLQRDNAALAAQIETLAAELDRLEDSANNAAPTTNIVKLTEGK